MRMNNRDTDKFTYITEGPIFGSLVKLSLPIMISQFMHTLYNLADTLWVGRVGASAVAAISISFPLLFLMIAIGVGLTIAGTAIIAQYKGAGNSEEINHVLGQMISFIGVLSVFLAVVGFFSAEQLIIWMGAEPAVVREGSEYLRIIFAGMPFMFGFFIFSSVLRGVGDTVTPAVMMFVSVLMNIILDPLLIFGIWIFPEMSVAGAAVATIFSRAVVTIYAVFLMKKGIRGVKLTSANMIPDFKIIKMIIKIGIPSSVEQSMISLGQLLMTALVTTFGTMTLAAYGIVNRIVSMPIILAFGLAAATTTMVGQNIGAEKKERAEKTALVSILTIFASLSVLGIIMFISPRFLVGVFNKAPDVLKYGEDYLRITGLTVGFIGVMNVGNGVFKGAGKTVPPMIISTASHWLFRVSLGYLFAMTLGWNQAGLWWAIAIANIAGALLGVGWLKVSDWSTKIIEDKPELEELEMALQED